MSRKISEFVRPQGPDPYQPHPQMQPSQPRPQPTPQITTAPQPIRPVIEQPVSQAPTPPNPGETLPPVDLEFT